MKVLRSVMKTVLTNPNISYSCQNVWGGCHGFWCRLVRQ